MSSPGTPATPELPAVDARLVAPDSHYEIDDGKLVPVAPSDESHANRHSKISALLEAHVTDDFDVASDMLTRTSETSDVAPDASVYPRTRDPATGGRRLEELAFEVVATQSLADAAHKAAKLAGRGVRRCFAIDVARARAFEWSPGLATWAMLHHDATIADPAFVVPLPVAALVHAAKVDDAVVAALVAKGNPVIAALAERARAEGIARGRAEGMVTAVLALLALRDLRPLPHERDRIAAETDFGRLERWLAVASSCGRVSELFEVA
jgi:Uma2 family endonuclease